MSFSFQFTEATKEAAKARVVKEMGQVVDVQPSHAKDRDAVIAAAGAYIDLLADREGHDIAVSVHGSVGWIWSDEDPNGASADAKFVQASIGVSVSHVAKA